MWALARLRYRPGSDWVQIALMASEPKLEGFSPQVRASVSTIQGVNQVQGVTESIGDRSLNYLLSLAPLPLQLIFIFPHHQHLANTLWALSRLDISPELPWLLSYERSASARLGGFQAMEARQVRDALARMMAGSGPATLPPGRGRRWSSSSGPKGVAASTPSSSIFPASGPRASGWQRHPRLQRLLVEMQAIAQRGEKDQAETSGGG